MIVAGGDPPGPAKYLELRGGASQITLDRFARTRGMQLSTQERRILVNGEATATHSATLAELLIELGYGDREVATALNGTFVPRTARAAAQLAPQDAVEIVAPRQGG
jgi:sulfur carrier protein